MTKPCHENVIRVSTKKVKISILFGCSPADLLKRIPTKQLFFLMGSFL